MNSVTGLAPQHSSLPLTFSVSDRRITGAASQLAVVALKVIRTISGKETSIGGTLRIVDLDVVAVIVIGTNADTVKSNPRRARKVFAFATGARRLVHRVVLGTATLRVVRTLEVFFARVGLAQAVRNFCRARRDFVATLPIEAGIGVSALELTVHTVALDAGRRLSAASLDTVVTSEGSKALLWLVGAHLQRRLCRTLVVVERLGTGPILATPFLVFTRTLLVGVEMVPPAQLWASLLTKEASVVAGELGTVQTARARWLHVINDPLVALANVWTANESLVSAPPLGCLVRGEQGVQ